MATSGSLGGTIAFASRSTNIGLSDEPLEATMSRTTSASCRRLVTMAGASAASCFAVKTSFGPVSRASVASFFARFTRRVARDCVISGATSWTRSAALPLTVWSAL